MPTVALEGLGLEQTTPLRIPYTFYPTALPHWIAWTLFLTTIVGGVIVGVRRGRNHGWTSGAVAGLVAAVAIMLGTVLASMVITFFTHDV